VRLLGVDSTLSVGCDGYDPAMDAPHAAERAAIWRRLQQDLGREALQLVWRGGLAEEDGDSRRSINRWTELR
jgi:hypothetical protein